MGSLMTIMVGLLDERRRALPSGTAEALAGRRYRIVRENGDAEDEHWAFGHARWFAARKRSFEGDLVPQVLNSALTRNNSQRRGTLSPGVT
jgi:hypothetical protein